MAKKITKKQLNAMPGYIVLVDYKAGHTPILKYVDIDVNVTDIAAALDACTDLFTEDVYMLKIAQKTDIIEKDVDGFYYVVYKNVLASRTRGKYHTISDKHNSEFAWNLAKYPEWNHTETYNTDLFK